jgi:hypothetical protein
LQRLALTVLVFTFALRATAHAQTCNPTTCAAKDSATACNTSTWSCAYIAYVGYICDPSVYKVPPVGTACESDNNPCTTDACGGTAGQTYGDGVCHHTAVANGTGCGTGKVCNNGGCGCAAGSKACGAGCIPNANCCADSDCPGDPANHRVGVCGAGVCGMTCASGYKPCGGNCIGATQCCQNSDCMTPPSGCYNTAGTCSGGVCNYTYNDGAACNADNTKCTPNNTCKSGSCIADTAHTVKCVQRECHTAPSCNASTGNCDDAAQPAGTACGGNGCTPASTCGAQGVCSATTKDCSNLTTNCKVGICDPQLPTATNCTTMNVANDTPCTLADMCQLMTACVGGACVGTPKICAPSAPCRTAACNPTTGDCDEQLSPLGSSCEGTIACLQHASCDASGTCQGDFVADGSPCDNPSCSVAATCVTGECKCFGENGGASVGASDDAGVTSSDSGKHGCAVAVGGAAGSPVLLALVLLWIAARVCRVWLARG